MGCLHSRKIVYEIKDTVTDVNVVQEQDNFDERIPLDKRQVFKLKKSWNAIKRHLEEAGVEMFIK